MNNERELIWFSVGLTEIEAAVVLEKCLTDKTPASETLRQIIRKSQAWTDKTHK